MGRASVKENKNIYQLSREAANLTRAEASEAMPGISESQIVRFENDEVVPQPEDVLLMSSAYHAPGLPNHFCTQVCQIGKETLPAYQVEDLPKLVLKVLTTVNQLEKEKDRLIEITADEMISDDELHDFVTIEAALQKIAATSGSLQLWIRSTIDSGSIDKTKLQTMREQVARESGQ